EINIDLVKHIMINCLHENEIWQQNEINNTIIYIITHWEIFSAKYCTMDKVLECVFEFQKYDILKNEIEPKMKTEEEIDRMVKNVLDGEEQRMEEKEEPTIRIKLDVNS